VISNSHCNTLVHQYKFSSISAIRTTRSATQTSIINGVTIPKGIIIEIPIEYIHHNPNIWSDPEDFIPER